MREEGIENDGGRKGEEKNQRRWETAKEYGGTKLDRESGSQKGREIWRES